MIREETRQAFCEWWKRENSERPLVSLLSKKKHIDPGSVVDIEKLIKTDEDRYMSPEVAYHVTNNMVNTYDFHADAFPYINLNLGPGSMAAYLKCEPRFSKDTVWYKEAECERISELLDVSFEKSTRWWRYHLDMVKKANEISDGEYAVAIPDIVENIDIAAALRGPQNLCYDMHDDPDDVKKLIGVIDDNYFKYYDPFYEELKFEDDSSVYTAFSIWGPGRTAKVQSDFSALISPAQFDDFVLPSLKKQCERFDSVLYHLDGKEAIKHVDSIITVDKIDAINWSPGDGSPDGGDEVWYPMYDKIIGAGKGMWICIGEGDCDRWIDCAVKILKRYGNRGIYLLFGSAESCEDAQRILKALKY